MAKKRRKIEVIDLFSGVGGLTYGLRKSGLSVLAGVDNDQSCDPDPEILTLGRN